MSKTAINIWITGASGQLGQCLRHALNPNSALCGVFSQRADVNLEDDAAVKNWIHQNDIKVVINTAAYTAVDRAEDEPDLARHANADIPQVLAEACCDAGIPLIHISTDYVFDGTSEKPYSETDTENPQSQYGLTKWLGEQEVLHAHKRNLVIRTSWLYSEFGHNFVKTMLRLGAEKESLRVVNDQRGCPTYAGELANVLVTISEKLSDNPDKYGGIYHFANSGETTWFGLATEIMKQHSLTCRVEPCTTVEYPTKAVRPANSVLDTRKIQSTFEIEINHWKDALSEALSKLKNS